MFYSGLTGTPLKATYREFIEETARPTFYQELQYELGESWSSPTRAYASRY